MPYLGRQGALAPLTSADIPAGIVEGTDVAFLENSSGQDLGGTYSTERMYLSGRTGSAPNDYNYKPTGDVTVTGHLALGTIADEDVVITQDSTERTITGSGTLEAGNVLQDTHRTSLTDMTGELGSVVTGSPNLNLTTGTLGSGVTFPAGHLIKIQENVFATSNTTATTSYIVACASDNFTVLNSTSTLYISGFFQWNTTNSNSKIKITYSTDNFSNETSISESATLGLRNNNTDLIDMLVPFSEKLTHGLSASTGIKFQVYVNRYQGSGTITVNQYDDASFRIMEVM